MEEGTDKRNGKRGWDGEQKRKARGREGRKEGGKRGEESLK